jgi:uncharacterized membrane protein
MRGSRALDLLLGAIAVAVGQGSALAADVSDTEALAIARKHCSPCHAQNPTHQAFDRAPKGLRFETIDQLKAKAAEALEQVEDRTMPLGNETDMTEEEREALGRWVRALK